MPSSCTSCFKDEILPYIDFLHPMTYYQTKRKTKCSKLGTIFSFLFILTFIILFLIIYWQSKKNPSISYSQDFIKKRELVGKKITLGFNVSDEWKNQVIFTLYDQDDKIVNLSICDENLEESKNFTYYCVINYSIQKSNTSAYSLKLHLNLTKKIKKEVKVPFSISIREPNINHSNIDNPLDIYDETSINKFRCFFKTTEITSYRRYLKLISYTTYGGYFSNDNYVEELYLDDFEDSRKIDKSKNGEDENFLGSYRILLSKKIDIYERKYDTGFSLFSQLFSYYSPICFIFAILIKICVSPNDNIRIYEALKEKDNSFTDPERIFNSFKEKKTIKQEDFKNKLKRNKCQKFWDKFIFICCHCCNENPRTEYLYIISDYIDKNLSPEYQLVNSVKDDKSKEEAQQVNMEMPNISNPIINKSDSSYYDLKKESLI